MLPLGTANRRLPLIMLFIEGQKSFIEYWQCTCPNREVENLIPFMSD
jgi:hypothetical protein